MKTRVLLVALGLAGLSLFASVTESAAPIVGEETARVQSLAPSTLPTTRSIAALPTTTPPREPTAPAGTLPPGAGYAAASRPALAPQRTVVSLPTVAPSKEPERERTGCDPAYPDERTCIPPGPPFDQGCAITDERRFTVLAPDPQGMDHDGDGIGREPIGSR